MQIVSEYIALLQDDVDPKNATEERHCCWQIEEVSGFVTLKTKPRYYRWRGSAINYCMFITVSARI